MPDNHGISESDLDRIADRVISAEHKEQAGYPFGSNKRYLTEDDVERIAEKAAERALEKVYGQIGKSMVTKALWVVGALALGFAAAKGWFVNLLK